MENFFMNWDDVRKTHVLAELETDNNGNHRFLPIANFESIGELNLFRSYLLNHPTKIAFFRNRYNAPRVVRYVDYQSHMPRFIY